ncbi:thioesterase family protein [Desulfosoma caldarium]|uniref:Thioesterase superfamily protein n=1 Tax=Desulfosoma caldarium TaxID=610254 RepID=A0A3N1VNI5_9BACT|nr:thioesterase family protein [Desulfosoma caldarium]ROR03500.1 thioesterase superfamily protein [Desulfosoma caldarium]
MGKNLTVGMSKELTLKTLPEHSAQRFFQNLPNVFATPFLGGFMEQVCASLIDEHLEPGMQSVGMSMNLKHIAPTPLGMEIKVVCEVTAIEGRKVTFKLEAFDEVEKVGEATHERFLIKADKFNAHVLEKAKKISPS